MFRRSNQKSDRTSKKGIKLLAVSRLHELGLTLEQIADALSLSPEQVKIFLSL